MEICEKVQCTGCQLCQTVCPKNAITFEPDSKGFLHPIIDEYLCIKCGLCIKSCPVNLNLEHHDTPRCFAAWAKNNEVRTRSVSGGLFYTLAASIIKKGGVVFGAKMSNLEVVHSYTECLNGLQDFQGSKYIQSNLGNTYKDVKTFLKQGRLVLFSGTPCQNAALISYIGKRKYDNLYLIDIVCHGVPNTQVFQSYLQDLNTKHKDTITNVLFRQKTPDCFKASMKYQFQSGKVYAQSIFQDAYFRAFVSNYLLRESCFQCKYVGVNRVSDITLADFWGYSPNSLKFRNFKKGISVVLTNTSKGYKLFNNISCELNYEERNLQEAIRGNRNLSKPQLKPERYDEFWKQYLSGFTLSELQSAFYPPKYHFYSTKDNILLYVRMILPKKIFSFYKKLKKINKLYI